MSMGTTRGPGLWLCDSSRPPLGPSSLGHCGTHPLFSDPSVHLTEGFLLEDTTSGWPRLSVKGSVNLLISSEHAMAAYMTRSLGFTQTPKGVHEPNNLQDPSSEHISIH